MSAGQPDPNAQPLPRSLFGYDVVDRLGFGAASTIYAVTGRDGQVYALKHVIRKTEKDDRFIAQLENEFTVSRQFRHPGLRKVIDFKVNRSLLRTVKDAALVLEMVDATPLDQQKPKDIPTILNIFIQAAKAVSALHYLLYVHCDIKPNNFLYDATGKVKLIDFGQAARTGTVKERIQGTPDFIAPEQVKLKPISVKTDIYSFGATLYWAISGQRVPTLFTVKKSERDIVTECRFATPRELNPEVPEELSELVMQSVQMEAARRPRDMNEVIDRLTLIQAKAG